MIGSNRSTDHRQACTAGHNFFIPPRQEEASARQIDRLRRASLAALSLIRFGFTVLAIDIDAEVPAVTVAHTTHCRLLEASAWPVAVEMDREQTVNHMVAGYNGCEIHWFVSIANTGAAS